MSDTRVSVCMATYNGEKYIREQLYSILMQLTNRDEVVIVDDCSTDSTVKIINSINDNRIRLYINNSNSGVIKTFETAINHAVGKYIFLSDQDDIWMPEKVDTVLYYFENEAVDLVVSDAYIMNNDIIELDTFFRYRQSKPGIMNNFIKNSFIGCCMAFKSSIKDKIQNIPQGFSMHDLWIGLIYTKYGVVKFIPERLIIYRRHENNVTGMHHSGLKKMLGKRITDFRIFATSEYGKL